MVLPAIQQTPEEKFTFQRHLNVNIYFYQNAFFAQKKPPGTCALITNVYAICTYE
jgi:hypothetical protein